MKKILLLLIVGVGLFVSCSKTSPTPGTGPGTGTTFVPDCSGVAKTYSGDVSPIISSSCATNSGCHGSGSTNGPGPLLSYSQVFNAKALIRNAVATGIMPKTGSLDAGQKTNILCWIDQGAPNN